MVLFLIAIVRIFICVGTIATYILQPNYFIATKLLNFTTKQTVSPLLSFQVHGAGERNVIMIRDEKGRQLVIEL